MQNAEEVLSLYSKVFAPSENAWVVEDILEDVNYRIFTVDEAGAVISTMTGIVCKNAVGRGDPYLILDNIATDPEFQGKGLARKLYKEAKVWAKEKSCSKIIIVSNKKYDLEEFYTALGLEGNSSKVYIERL